MAEYGFALKRLAHSAYPRMPPETCEELALGQFVDGLSPRGLKRHVQFGHPSSLNQAISLAVEYEVIEGATESRKPLGHSINLVAEEGREDKVLDVLNQVAASHKEIVDNQEHLNIAHQELLASIAIAQRVSENGQKSVGERKRKERCRHCLRRGHVSRLCPGRDPRNCLSKISV